MTAIPILLDTTDKVLRFAREVGKYEEEMDLEAGRSYIDAKSMLGIFSLNLNNPLILHIHADEDRAGRIADELQQKVCN